MLKMTRPLLLLFALSTIAHPASADLKVPEVTQKRAKSLKACLARFKEACGRYPTTDQALDILAPSRLAQSQMKCNDYSPCKEAQVDLSQVPTDSKLDFRTDGIRYDLQYTSDGDTFQIYWGGPDGKQRVPLFK
jgi:hypothetical protein